MQQENDKSHADSDTFMVGGDAAKISG